MNWIIDWSQLSPNKDISVENVVHLGISLMVLIEALSLNSMLF